MIKGDTERAPRYSAGWNMPGYLPEVDPEPFGDFASAVEYLRDTVERFWDEDYDASDESADKLASDAKWLDVHTALHNAGVTYDNGTHRFGAFTGDQSLHFWITPIEGEL